MIKYTIRKNKKNRYAFRLTGILLMLLGACQITLTIMGYGKGHMIGTVICGLLFIYGVYLMIHSFKKNAYDTIYEFDENEFRVTHNRGTSTYTYDMIDDFSLVTPEDPLIYSLITIKIGKETYILEFSYKKDSCDRIYDWLNSHVTAAQISKDMKKD